MMKVTFERSGSCRLWHRWQLIKRVAQVDYFACRDCEARQARQARYPHVYQPRAIDHRWVLGLADAIAPPGVCSTCLGAGHYSLPPGPLDPGTLARHPLRYPCSACQGQGISRTPPPLKP